MLACLSMFRGTDSTGIAVAKRKGSKFEYWTDRDLMHPVAYVEQPAFIAAAKSQPTAIIGHSRAATIGDVAIGNAHPHTTSHIIGVHNGTVRGLVPPERKNVTDSQVIFEKIEEDGLEPTLRTLDRLNGAYALVWFNKQHQTLNFIRNKERPLSFCTGAGGSTMYWASEQNDLAYLANKMNGIDHIQTFVPDQLYSLRLGDGVRKWKVGPREAKTYQSMQVPDHRRHFLPHQQQAPVPRMKTATDYPYVPPVKVAEQPSKLDDVSFLTRPGVSEMLENINRAASENIANPFVEKPKTIGEVINGKVAQAIADEVDESKSTVRVLTKDEVNRVLTPSGVPVINDVYKKPKTPSKHMKNYKGYRGMTYTVDFVKRALADGCSNCGSQPDIEDTDVNWFSYNRFLCGDCANNGTVRTSSGNQPLYPGVVVYNN